MAVRQAMTLQVQQRQHRDARQTRSTVETSGRIALGMPLPRKERMNSSTIIFSIQKPRIPDAEPWIQVAGLEMRGNEKQCQAHV